MRGVEEAVMTPRGTLIRVKKFQVDEKRRKVVCIEDMLATLERTAVELEREVKVEQHRGSIRDASRFAYLAYAKGAAQRRENLKRSADGLKTELDVAKSELADAAIPPEAESDDFSVKRINSLWWQPAKWRASKQV
jgi:flagellar FliJ protein